MNNLAMELIKDKQEEIEDELTSLKEKVQRAIKELIKDKERVVFANVVKAAGISPIIISKYPELRTHILKEIKKQKELQYINNKIEKIVERMIKRNIRLSYMGIINRCKFTANEDKVYPEIREIIRNIVINNSNTFYKNFK